jgi:hypothetical protein
MKIARDNRGYLNELFGCPHRPTGSDQVAAGHVALPSFSRHHGQQGPLPVVCPAGTGGQVSDGQFG